MDKMRRSSAGQQWEDFNRKKQEADQRELEARKAAANRARRDQIGGLNFPPPDATLPGVGQPYLQDSRSSPNRHREDMPELEAQMIPPPRYSQQYPPDARVSACKAPNVDGNEQIRLLQKEVTHKESKIKTLESEVKDERDRRQRLQAERHEAVDAQRRAEDALWKSKQRVSDLGQLLDDSIEREKELEGELGSARQEVSELKRQLHEERFRYESDIRARETRENQIKQQLEDSYGALENEMRRDRRAARDAESVRECEAQSKIGRQLS